MYNSWEDALLQGASYNDQDPNLRLPKPHLFEQGIRPFIQHWYDWASGDMQRQIQAQQLAQEERKRQRLAWEEERKRQRLAWEQQRQYNPWQGGM